MACASPSILGPLSFPEPEDVQLPFDFAPWEQSNFFCLFCRETFCNNNGLPNFVEHLKANHLFIIAQLEEIVSIKGYIDYWRIRFQQVGVNVICPQFEQSGRLYHLLSPAINHEDISLRRGLATKRLEWVLNTQKKEREEGSYGRGCLFCRHVETGTRLDYLVHLADQHNVQLGRPNNIVFIDKLVEKIESQLVQLKCIYCELIFRDREILKEHMRKKFHKRINPKNPEYDRFYVRSYVEGGKDDDESDEIQGRMRGDEACDWSQWREEGADWSDWKEDPRPIVCLFCTQGFTDWEAVLTHMHDAHRFSYRFVMGKCNYYEQVKIVNFIRREVHLSRCYECKAKFADQNSLFEHMTAESHCSIPDRSDWDHPQFFFPTYENDSFLCCIEDNEEDPVDQLAAQMENQCGVMNAEPSNIY